MKRLALSSVGFLLALGFAPLAAAQSLHFAEAGVPVKSIALSELRAGCGVERVQIASDPYYGRAMAFWACPLRAVFEMGFGRAPQAQSDRNIFLRALDGYTKPASEAKLAGDGGWLALSDATLGTPAKPAWEPIDRRQVDPAPFYLIWSGATQNDIHRFPWPYQLSKIEIAPFESEYPHTRPLAAAPDSPALDGYAVFRVQCISCHAINGEGGLIGPDLNIPRSIVEYRPAEQIKAYIRNPQSFRYTTMPPHPDLSDAQLDALLAYFEVMKEHKWDARGR
jgi:mono/diheme cytochrome c family protein